MQANNIRVALPVTHTTDEFDALDTECVLTWLCFALGWGPMPARRRPL